jgi:hypothetical protein
MEAETRQFARRMAIQCIGYWRKAKSDGLHKTAKYHRREAMFFIRAYKTGAIHA